jgi:hypothetical protein
VVDAVDRRALRPATREEVRDSLAFAMRHRDGKRVHDAGCDSFMARIAAERLVDHLARSGFVVMRRPLAAASPGVSPRVPSRLPPKE